MARFLAIYLCVLLGFTSADAEFVKYANKGGYGGFALVQIKAGRKRISHRVKRLKSKKRRHSANRPAQPSWDDVIRRNSPSPDSAMLPEEYGQWLRNLNDQELDLYLRFRLTDAMPFSQVEAEAKRRKIR